MRPLYDLSTIRSAEATALAAGLPLMLRAGEAAACCVRKHFSHAQKVLVLVGPGHNGGDGLVCAKLLREAGLNVLVYSRVSPRPGHALNALTDWKRSGGKQCNEIDLTWPDLIVDALYGIGFSRPFEEKEVALVLAVNKINCPVLALDVPSGLDAMTGWVATVAIKAVRTLTFLVDKPGLHTAAGQDFAGEVEIADLDCQAFFPGSSTGWLVHSAPRFLSHLTRCKNTHKGKFGTIGILGGQKGMLGAPLLAGRAALLNGAGKVMIGFLAKQFLQIDPLYPELMLHSASDLVNTSGITHWLIGPGLGISTGATKQLAKLLLHPHPLVLDADALNLVAKEMKFQKMLAQRNDATILTPHPLEAARLLGCRSIDIQSNRIEAALTLSKRFNAIVLLKGSGTIVSDSQQWYINTSGNAALSNAGQGDVLSGLILGLLAQNLSPLEACICAAWLQGKAADTWKEKHQMGIGMAASEVITLVRKLLNCTEPAG